jgi:hypothetical protein
LVLDAAADWYSWTQLVVPDFLHEAVYLPPLTTVFCGWVVVLVLVLTALLLRTVQRSRPLSTARFPPLFRCFSPCCSRAVACLSADGMAAGFVANDLSDPVNLIGKIVLNAAAIGALALLGRKVRGAGVPAAE